MKTELKKEKGPKGPKELFYSIYPFTSNSSNEIDLTSIDCPFHILTKPRHGWVKICKADDSEICGYAPFDYLAPETSLYRIPFFHGTMTRQESVSLMKLERPETILFLIRKSSLKGYYALDILEPTGCLKYFVIAIEHDEDNKILYKYSVKNVVHVFYKIEDIVNLIYNRATNPQPIRRLPPKLPGIG
ncbi:MAG: Protein tyrosine kinase 6, partial [Marteilia pararefringens]